MKKHLLLALKRGFLFLLIPVFIFYIINAIVSVLDNLWAPFFFLLFKKNLFWGVGFLATAALMLIIGLLLTSKVFQGPIITALTYNLLNKTPILNLFFGKEFFSKEQLEKTKVVLVEYPSPGWLQIGFLVGKQKMADGDDLYKIIIPTIPVPATGFLGLTKITKGNKIIHLKNSPLEILKLILSCGLTDIELEKEPQK